MFFAGSFVVNSRTFQYTIPIEVKLLRLKYTIWPLIGFIQPIFRGSIKLLQEQPIGRNVSTALGTAKRSICDY